MTPTERKWFERVRAWRESGLAAGTFSTGKGFAASSLVQWSYALKKRGLSPPPAAGPVRVRLARVARWHGDEDARTLTVEVGHARVRVPPGADEATVRAVLGVLLDGAGAR